MPTTLEDAADAFYAAGNRLLAGDASAFEAIWSDADDITDLGPTGAIRIGRAAVMEQFAIDRAGDGNEHGIGGEKLANEVVGVKSPHAFSPSPPVPGGRLSRWGSSTIVAKVPSRSPSSSARMWASKRSAIAC